MNAGTGFFVGVGTVIAAIGIGFAGGYTLTSTDTGTKPQLAYEKRTEEARARQDEIRNDIVTKPQVVASTPDTAAPASQTFDLSSPVVAAASALIKPVQAAPAPAEAPTVAQPVAQPASEPRISNQKQLREIAQQPAQPRKEKSKIARGDSLDMAEVKRAVAQDIRKRQARGEMIGTTAYAADDEPQTPLTIHIRD